MHIRVIDRLIVFFRVFRRILDGVLCLFFTKESPNLTALKQMILDEI